MLGRRVTVIERGIESGHRKLCDHTDDGSSSMAASAPSRIATGVGSSGKNRREFLGYLKATSE